MKRIPWTFFPLGIFLLLAVVLASGFDLHPAEIPSPLITQKTPAFSLSALQDNGTIFTEAIFPGHVTFFNVWSSWCEACLHEHAQLLKMAREKRLQLVGLNYRDEPEKALAWLKQHGNPYRLVLSDPSGQTGVDWGVYGVPETFVIDKKGIIRYRQSGVIDTVTWNRILRPLVEKLNNE